jgi:hypothetical protein
MNPSELTEAQRIEPMTNNETTIIVLRTKTSTLWWAPHLNFWCRLPKALDSFDRAAITEAVLAALSTHTKQAAPTPAGWAYAPPPPPGPYCVRIRSGPFPASLFTPPDVTYTYLHA